MEQLAGQMLPSQLYDDLHILKGPYVMEDWDPELIEVVLPWLFCFRFFLSLSVFRFFPSLSLFLFLFPCLCVLNVFVQEYSGARGGGSLLQQRSCKLTAVNLRGVS